MRTEHGDQPLSVVIGAGGTGGHIYPGLALAEALRRADPRAAISFVGTDRGLEGKLIPEAGYRLHTVDMIPFDASSACAGTCCPPRCCARGASARRSCGPRARRWRSGWAATPARR